METTLRILATGLGLSAGPILALLQGLTSAGGTLTGWSGATACVATSEPGK